MTSERQILNDRYRVLSSLGTGGMGSVWLAEDQLLERRVALKELIPYPYSADLAESRARALVEARAMARVRHRAIVRIHDFFFEGDDPWIVMEYISGRSLAEMIRAGRLDERTIAAIGLSVVQGLRFVHAAGIVHRDVKPANILVDADRSVVLVDFGIAKIAGDIPLTGQSKILGTIEFMAPERLLGRSAKPPSDLWSLGATLYYALEGHSPFAGREGELSLQAIITAILNDKPPSPLSGGPLASLLLRLLSKNPVERPDVAEITAVLEAILRTKPGLPGKSRATSSRLPPSLETVGKPSMLAIGTRQYTRAGTPQIRWDSERVDDRELSRREMADAIRGADKPYADSGAESLLGQSDVKAAQILAGCSLNVAAELLEGITAKQARRAGTILQILSAGRAGKILDYLSPEVAAAVVAAMPIDDAVRILSRSDARTVADVVMELPSHRSGQLIEAMPGGRAVAVLSHARPATVAATLTVIKSDLSSKLLTGFGPDFRALVLRHM